MTSCTRLAHLSRSVILRVSPLMVHCHCSKGKQRQLRESGFDFAIPRKFVTLPFDWWEAAKPSYLSLSASQRRELGLVYDQIKLEPLTREATVEAARAVVRKQVQETDSLITTLPGVCFRPWQCCWASTRRRPWPSQTGSSRPTSIRSRSCPSGLICAIAAGNATTWESLGIADWKDHMAACVQSVEKGMTSDVKSEWTSSELTARSSRRFVLRPARNMAYQEAPLLNVVEGKVIWLRMRGAGEVLCLSYQTGQCQAADCRLEHRHPSARPIPDNFNTTPPKSSTRALIMAATNYRVQNLIHMLRYKKPSCQVGSKTKPRAF